MSKKLLLFLSLAAGLWAQNASNPIPSGAALPGTCTVRDTYFLTSGTVGLYLCTATNTWTIASTGTVAGLHVISFVIDGAGAVITAGDLNLFPTAAFACTISRIDVSADVSGSITVDIWKRAGAIPASGNKISASAPATLSSSQLSQNGSLSGWGTSVAVGDVFGGTVTGTPATVTRVLIQIWCQ